jgi:DNA-binding response OmpR family regulator
MSVASGDILVVDDQPVNVRLLATMLSQLGYKVRKATSGEMALTAIHAEPPDLILLDITMPHMDGYELCEILKKDAKTADIPVIFVSALDESMDKTKAFEVGAVDYVAKPFQWVEVQARVKTQLALRSLQQQSSALGEGTTALWAQSMPAIAPFLLAAQSAILPTLELFDWQLTTPNLMHLTLANIVRKPGSLVLLAMLGGLFKGLSLEQNFQKRMCSAQSLLASELQQAEESLGLFHGELNREHRTLTYAAQGYTIALVRGQNVMVQSATSTIAFEAGDRLLIFSGNLQLQPDHSQLTDILTNGTQHEIEADASAILRQIADVLKGAIGYEGSVIALHCFP